MPVDNDPAWDMPQVNWQQQGSFIAGELPPLIDPDAGTPVCIGPFAREWLPYVLGAMDGMRIPNSWIVANDDVLNTTLERVDRLKEIFSLASPCCSYELRFDADCVLRASTDGGATWNPVTGWAENFSNCVSGVIIPPIPPNPGPDPILQHACNIAGYVATEILQLCITKAVTDFNANRTQLQFANDVLQDIAFAFPITALAVDTFVLLYNEYTTLNIGDFTSASTDPVLWSAVTCAIYDAIKTSGYITAANLPALITNICGISYTFADVISALCSFVNNLGLQNFQGIQNIGAVDNVDCTACGGPAGWCKQFDFTVTNGPFNIPSGAPGQWTSTVGWNGLGPGGAHDLRTETDPIPDGHATHLEIHYSVSGTSDMTSGLRLRHAGATVAHWDLPQAPGSYVFTATTSTTFDALWFGGDSDTSQIVTYLKVSGTGTNPFGTTNC